MSKDEDGIAWDGRFGPTLTQENLLDEPQYRVQKTHNGHDCHNPKVS
jgi:hypothetical protein